MALSSNIRLEHRLLAIDQAGVVDLMLEIRAPRAERPAERPPTALAVVVDESGSMAGGKLATAVRSLDWLSGRLDSTDRIALVGFDNNARLIRGLLPAAGHALRQAIAQLRPGGTTNLSGGLILGLEQLEAKTDDGPRALLLLSDGHANQGIIDPDQLVELVSSARQRGVVVSTIGFGEGFSEDLLRAMADAGGGNAHYVETPEDAPAVFAEELVGLTELVAQAVSVEVRPGAAVTHADAINDYYPQAAIPHGFRLDLGDAYAGDLRRVVVRLHVPALGELGPCSVADIVLRYTTVAGSLERHTIRIPVAVNLVSADEAAAEAADLQVTTEVESLLADRARERAIRLADIGDFQGAKHTLMMASDRLRSSSAQGGPMTQLAGKADQLSEEHLLFDRSRYGPKARKTASYRSQHSKRNRNRPPL